MANPLWASGRIGRDLVVLAIREQLDALEAVDHGWGEDGDGDSARPDALALARSLCREAIPPRRMPPWPRHWPVVADIRRGGAVAIGFENPSNRRRVEYIAIDGAKLTVAHHARGKPCAHFSIKLGGSVSPWGGMFDDNHAWLIQARRLTPLGNRK